MICLNNIGLLVCWLGSTIILAGPSKVIKIIFVGADMIHLLPFLNRLQGQVVFPVFVLANDGQWPF
jgi:hypothetical protein